jgi:hypothetical protein
VRKPIHAWERVACGLLRELSSPRTRTALHRSHPMPKCSIRSHPPDTAFYGVRSGLSGPVAWRATNRARYTKRVTVTPARYTLPHRVHTCSLLAEQAFSASRGRPPKLASSTLTPALLAREAVEPREKAGKGRGGSGRSGSRSGERPHQGVPRGGLDLGRRGRGAGVVS